MSAAEYERGHNDGYEQGRQAGYLDGYSEGIRQGREEGYEDGYAAGYDACESDVNYPDDIEDDVFEPLPSDEEILDSENYHEMGEEENFTACDNEYFEDMRDELGGEDE